MQLKAPGKAAANNKQKSECGTANWLGDISVAIIGAFFGKRRCAGRANHSGLFAAEGRAPEVSRKHRFWKRPRPKS
jgi:hypothetical protein